MGDTRIECDQCVLATGAWIPLILAESRIILKRKLVRRACTVIAFEEEIVPGITVCYDIKHFDSKKKQLIQSNVSLVPYKRKTLAAGRSYRRLDEKEEPEDIRPTEEDVETLRSELYQAFPLLRMFTRWTPYSCIKTELDTGEKTPNLLPHVFDRNDHDVDGLLVALPGKASLMFNLATKVLEKLELIKKTSPLEISQTSPRSVQLET